MVLVSVIVPCFNQSEFLEDALKSVLNQTFKLWECIIVNDGSQDKTKQIALKWVARDSRFVYIEKRNEGVCKARNDGITASKGIYILPLDADDYVCDNYIETCVHELTNNEKVLVVYGTAYKFGVENGVWDLEDYSFDVLISRNVIYCTALFRKSSWIEVHGYDVNLHFGLEDWEFWINILKNGGEARRVHSIKFFYRIKLVSRNTQIQTKKLKTLARDYIISKHIDYYTNKTKAELFLMNETLHWKIQNIQNFLTISQVVDIFLVKIKKYSINILRRAFNRF